MEIVRVIILKIYRYCGAGAAGDLLKGFPCELVQNEPDGPHQHIRTNIFHRFFKVPVLFSKSQLIIIFY